MRERRIFYLHMNKIATASFLLGDGLGDEAMLIFGLQYADRFYPVFINNDGLTVGFTNKEINT